jgi:GNAT superfamily N-acetyltransferase
MTDTAAMLDTSTFTDRAIDAMAGRAVHAAGAMGRPCRADDDLVVTWQADRGMFSNGVFVRTQPERWSDVLERAAAVIPADQPALVVSPYATPDLAPEGWHLVGHPPLMVRPAGGASPAPPAELTVTEVGDREGLEAFERTIVDGYPIPGLEPYEWGSFYDERVLGGPSRFYLGTVAGRPVATAIGHVEAGVNNVELVATLPDARGRGYGEALTRAATTVDPDLPAVLIASDLGRPVYERIGYFAVSRWTLWYRTPG